MTTQQKSIIKKIIKERERQMKKWGDQSHVDEKWLAILMEELGEIAQCVCKTTVPPINPKEAKIYSKEMIKEIIQTCAVLVAWLEDKDFNK